MATCASRPAAESPGEGDRSRRTFLRAVGGASLALAWPRTPQAASASADADSLAPLRLLVITDTHLGRQDNDAAERQWNKTADALAQAPGDLILHLGDVVDAGREPQYAIYKKIRERIGKPVHEIPGNHDPAELFARHLRTAVDTVVDHHWLRIVLMNNSRGDSHLGFLEPPQLDWLDQQCVEATRQNRFVLIAMHVPAHTNQHPDRGWYVRPDDGQRRFYEIMTRHSRRVLAAFHGHFHNGLRGWDDHAPIHEIVFPSALYNQDRGLEAKKAPGYNLPEFRPGYTEVAIERGVLKLHYRPLGVEEKTSKECRLQQLPS